MIVEDAGVNWETAIGNDVESVSSIWKKAISNDYCRCEFDLETLTNCLASCRKSALSFMSLIYERRIGA
jgi:hypothetical protein